MLYNIVISLIGMATNAPDYDMNDLGVLSYIYYLVSSQNERVAEARIEHEGKLFTWMDYQSLLTAVPSLHLNTAASLTKRIKKYEEDGYVKTKMGQSRRLYIRVTEKFDILLVDKNLFNKAKI